MDHRSFGKVVVLLLTAIVCGWTGVAWAQSGTVPTLAKIDASPGSAAPDQQLAVRTDEYVLQRGDDLEIRVYNIPELSAETKIRPDGKISLLLLNDVTAAGMTALQLGHVLSDAYSKDYRNPRVTVIVRNFISQNVYVGGEVAMPGIVPIPGKLTLASAVFRAGGFKETAQLSNVILLRDSGENGRPLVNKFNIKNVIAGRAEDVKLQPYDVVFVPRTKIARIDLFVKQYMRDVLPISTDVGFSYLLGGQFIPAK